MSAEALPDILLQAATSTEHTRPHVQETIALFATLRKPLLRYSLTFGVSSADVEEIVQETFLSLFQHLQNGKPRQNLPAWAFRVCHNLALKHRERSRGTQQVMLDDAAQHPDQSLNPEQQLLQSQRRARLQSVLRALPEQDRCCVSLRAEGLRYREIAEILGMSLGAVSLSLTRSLARFERADQE